MGDAQLVFVQARPPSSSGRNGVRGVPRSPRQDLLEERFKAATEGVRAKDRNSPALDQMSDPNLPVTEEAVERMEEENRRLEDEQAQRAARQQERAQHRPSYASDEMEEAKARLREVDPENSLLKENANSGNSCRAPTREEIDRVWNAYDRRVDSMASRISGGHARYDHGHEFGGDENSLFMESETNDTIRNADRVVRLDNGRTLFYNRAKNVVVIYDPNHRDAGTVFHPESREEFVNRTIRRSGVQEVLR